MIARLIPLVALLLAGCASQQPAIEVRTVEVRVPVSCLDRSDVPAPPAALPPLPNDARTALDVAVAKLVEFMGPKLDNRGGYVGKSSALLKGCSK